MSKLNYDLIPEELKRKAIDYCVKANKGFQGLSDLEAIEYLHSMTAVKIGEEILESQQIKKPVDMQVLVKSGVLCEFSNARDFSWSVRDFLVKTTFSCGLYNYSDKDGRAYDYCRPLYGYWHSAKNFDDVLNLIERLKEAGFQIYASHDEDCVYEFRITGMQPDRCEPWRCEG